ncbi:MAG: cyclic nucleotide-binding domain-containing protein [Bdellovibrionales bacterium]|nr:cyclic nucleotide-binding domain-containing protein [Bdellovibrionales bacterium]
MSALQSLKNCSLFEGWSDADLQKLISSSFTKNLTAGELLFTEGEASNSFFVVTAGTVGIQKSGRDGDGQSVSNIGTNSHFGEMALLVGKGLAPEKRSASAEALETTTIVEIPFGVFEKILNDSPQLGLHFYKNVSRSLAGRIRKTTEDLAGIKSLRLRSV